MKKIIFNWFTEKTIFYSILAFNVFLMLTVKFYPSMDGPSHLYNANLINQLLINKSEFISNYYVMNQEVIPNWISYLVLSIFNAFLPAWIAEKILLIIYIVGISISFRLLIKQLNPQNTGLSIFIFPFAYSFLFHLGFYNYCFSFIFLFFTIYYWLKNHDKNNWVKHIILFALFGLTYLSAILTFFFLGLCLAIFVIAFSIKEYFDGKKTAMVIKNLGKELMILLVLSLPALVFAFIFIKSTIFFTLNNNYTNIELLKWLFDVRCLIIYDYPGDEILTRQFFHIAIAILSISFFIRFYNKGSLFDYRKIRKADLFYIPLIICLFLFFTIPNGSNAGMMSDRICILFYMFLIIIVSSQAIPKIATNVFISLLLAFHLGLLFKHHNGAIRDLNRRAEAIYHSSNYIQDNSLILPVNLSENWLEPHFSNYLGIEKPIVILENYEASVGWFPVNWNAKELPKIKIGESGPINSLSWITNNQSPTEKQVDYVFLYGNTDKINNLEWSELNGILNKSFELIFVSQDKYIAIYKNKD